MSLLHSKFHVIFRFYSQSNISKGQGVGSQDMLNVRSSPSASDTRTVNAVLPIASVVDTDVESRNEKRM